MSRVTVGGETTKGASLFDILSLGSLGGGNKPLVTSADTRPSVGGGFTTSAGNTTLKPSGGLRFAANPATRGSMKALGNTVRLAGPASVGLLGLLSALGELEDDRPGETRGKNIADATGMGLGTATGAAIGGILGGMTPLGPLGAIGGSYLGSMLLGQAGKAASGGLYNLFDDPKARQKKDLIDNARMAMQLQYEAGLLNAELQRRQLNDAQARANEANFYNTANQSLLNRQQNAAATTQAVLQAIGY